MSSRLCLLIVALALGFALPAAAPALEPAAPPKPLIGINMDVGGEGRSTTATARLSLQTSYVDAVTSAGGVPIVLPPIASREDVRELVAAVDGIVLVGGRDIHPRRYGQAIHDKTNLLHPRREHFDFMLIEEAMRANKPILGVCLGMQELNVATGGQLIQDIPALTESTINHRPGISSGYLAHDVMIVEGTRLRSLAGAEALAVNSMHHQACTTLGPGVIVTARAPDGVIEGIEVTGHPFAIGVQWHPEHLTEASPHLAIYRGLVEAAAAHKAAAAGAKDE